MSRLLRTLKKLLNYDKGKIDPMKFENNKYQFSIIYHSWELT